MLSRITEKTFYKYLKCPNWVYFDVHALEKRMHDPLMEKLIDDGLLDEKQREIISDKIEIAEVTAEDQDEAFHQTLELMRAGRQTILHSVLIDKQFVGHPDVLEKVEGRSKLGNYYYVAIDIKRSRFLRDEYKFQGCFYAELLERVQGVKPVQGYVLTPDKTVLSYFISEFEGPYSLTLSEIEKIITGSRPAHFVTSGCKQSPWYKECRAESEECDDVSLLNRVWRQEVARLSKVGIKTISELAKQSLVHLEKLVPDVSPVRLEIMRDQAVAIKEHRHIIREKVNLPEAKTEIFFDIESDPLRDFDYLFGVLEVDGKHETYHSFFAASPEQEKDAWDEFVAFVERHIDSPIYHFGAFEVEVVYRFIARYGTSALAREAFERNMIDLLEIFRHSVIFPLSFYSLKDIAAYLGFEWRAEDASGANSVLWFEEWLRKKNQKFLLKIMEYNEDDVRATAHVQKWLHENAA